MRPGPLTQISRVGSSSFDSYETGARTQSTHPNCFYSRSKKHFSDSNCLQSDVSAINVATEFDFMPTAFLKNLMGGSKTSHMPHANAAVPKTALPQRSAQSQKAVYSKVFRWHHGPGEHDPKTVEIVGSFTNWYPVPLAKTPGSHGT
jgi:hypothetical protein